MDDQKMFETGVLELAQRLHMDAMGSGELSYEERRITALYLRKRLREWRTPLAQSEAFDRAVKMAINAALGECYEKRWNEREVDAT